MIGRYGLRDGQWERIGVLLPGRVGDWKNAHCRLSRWAERGVWERVFQPLSRDADNEYAMIDRTSVRAYQHGDGARKKTGRKPLGGAKAG